MAASSSPQPMVVGETNPVFNPQTTYSGLLNSKQAVKNVTKTQLKPIEYIHGEPTVKFTMEEREAFAIEEGLHQAIVIKLSSGAPDLRDLRTLLPKHLEIKGHCLIGSLAPRQLLLRCDQYDDYVMTFTRSVNYFSYNGKKHQYRIFPWSIGYNPKEETTKAAVWISLPNLAPDLFAKRSLLSIASAVGKPIAIDKATQVKSRPSTARVKVILDLLEKLPKRIRLQYLDDKTGKLFESFQEIVYDNLPLYCNSCKHQGHDEGACRLIQKKKLNIVQNEDSKACEDEATGEKFQGDLREFLNKKREQKDGEPQEKNEQIDILTPSIAIDVEVQNNAAMLVASTVNSGQQQIAANNDAAANVEVIKNNGDVSQAAVLGIKAGATRNSGDHVIGDNGVGAQDNCGEWTEVPNKKFSPGGAKVQEKNCSSPSCKEQTTKVPEKFVCSNTFDALMNNSDQELNAATPTQHTSNSQIAKISKEHPGIFDHDAPSPSLELVGEKITGQQPASAEKDKDLVKEHVSPPPLHSKLSPEAPAFVPKSVSANKNELVAFPINAYATDSTDEFFEEDDEEEMLDMCFEQVARDGDLSPRQQRSGSNKSKKKTHERQHSWDGRMTEEFVPRQLPMRLAKQNHTTVSTTLTRANKSKKK